MLAGTGHIAEGARTHRRLAFRAALAEVLDHQVDQVKLHARSDGEQMSHRIDELELHLIEGLLVVRPAELSEGDDELGDLLNEMLGRVHQLVVRVDLPKHDLGLSDSLLRNVLPERSQIDSPLLDGPRLMRFGTAVGADVWEVPVDLVAQIPMQTTSDGQGPSKRGGDLSRHIVELIPSDLLENDRRGAQEMDHHVPLRVQEIVILAVDPLDVVLHVDKQRVLVNHCSAFHLDCRTVLYQKSIAKPKLMQQKTALRLSQDGFFI